MILETTSDLEKDLETLLNLYCAENESNTADYLLAEYLMQCLENVNSLIINRDDFYGVRLAPGRKYAHVVDSGAPTDVYPEVHQLKDWYA